MESNDEGSSRLNDLTIKELENAENCRKKHIKAIELQTEKQLETNARFKKSLANQELFLQKQAFDQWSDYTKKQREIEQCFKSLQERKAFKAWKEHANEAKAAEFQLKKRVWSDFREAVRLQKAERLQKEVNEKKADKFHDEKLLEKGLSGFRVYKGGRDAAKVKEKVANDFHDKHVRKEAFRGWKCYKEQQQRVKKFSEEVLKRQETEVFKAFQEQVAKQKGERQQGLDRFFGALERIDNGRKVSEGFKAWKEHANEAKAAEFQLKKRVWSDFREAVRLQKNAKKADQFHDKKLLEKGFKAYKDGLDAAQQRALWLEQELVRQGHVAPVEQQSEVPVGGLSGVPRVQVPARLGQGLEVRGPVVQVPESPVLGVPAGPGQEPEVPRIQVPRAGVPAPGMPGAPSASVQQRPEVRGPVVQGLAGSRQGPEVPARREQRPEIPAPGVPVSPVCVSGPGPRQEPEVPAVQVPEEPVVPGGPPVLQVPPAPGMPEALEVQRPEVPARREQRPEIPAPGVPVSPVCVSGPGPRQEPEVPAVQVPEEPVVPGGPPVLQVPPAPGMPEALEVQRPEVSAEPRQEPEEPRVQVPRPEVPVGGLLGVPRVEVPRAGFPAPGMPGGSPVVQVPREPVVQPEAALKEQFTENFSSKVGSFEERDEKGSFLWRKNSWDLEIGEPSFVSSAQSVRLLNPLGQFKRRKRIAKMI